MTSRPVLALMLATSLCAGASLAAPGDPFGGDEPGCFPLNKNAAKCQHTVAKAASKALVCILGCHLKRADGKLADDTAEDACESTDPVKSCKAKYDKTTGPASKINALCPPCLDATARATIFATIESQLDNGTNAAVYCAPGTPFGGDDQGNAPALKSNDQKCEDSVAKALRADNHHHDQHDDHHDDHQHNDHQHNDHQHNDHQHDLPTPDRHGRQGLADGHRRSLQLHDDARPSRSELRLQYEFPGLARVLDTGIAERAGD